FPGFLQLLVNLGDGGVGGPGRKRDVLGNQGKRDDPHRPVKAEERNGGCRYKKIKESATTIPGTAWEANNRLSRAYRPLTFVRTTSQETANASNTVTVAANTVMTTVFHIACRITEPVSIPR